MPTLRLARMSVRQLADHLGESASKRMEAKTDLVPAARADHRAKDRVGFQNFGIISIDARAPPWLPDIVEQEDSAGRRIDCDRHFGIGVAQEARAALAGAGARDAARRLLQQHGPARIDRRPAAAQELV